MMTDLSGFSLAPLDQLTLLWTLVVALALDVAFGEPSNDWHPVAHLGQAIAWLEQRLYLPPPDPMPSSYADTNLLRGGLLVALIVGLAAAVGFGLIEAIHLLKSAIIARAPAEPFSYQLAKVAEIIALGIALKPCFALRALVEEGRILRRLLFRHQLADDERYLTEARERLRHLCSRSTTQLAPEEIAEVTISSMAENLCDSFVAPLLFYVLFGLPGAIAYRAINTLDAMVGYRGRYEFFGRCAAKLDDLANYVPARITGWLLVVAGWVVNLLGGTAIPIDPEVGAATMNRDHRLTPSPNGGWPMAAMAGLLGVQLRKRGVYQLGDRLRPACDRAIAASLILTAWAAALTVVTAVLFSRILAHVLTGGSP